MGNRILLIDGEFATVDLIGGALAGSRYGPFAVEKAATLAEGIDRINEGGFNAIMLNLYLPDSEGIETFNKLGAVAGSTPILILSRVEQEEIAKQAIENGAKDYFLLGHIEGDSLSHSLRNVIARQSAEDALYVERERAQVTLNSIGDAVISADMVGNVTYLNPVAEKMTGWSLEEANGQLLDEVLKIIDGTTREPVRSPIEMAMQRDKTVGLSAHSILVRRDGHELPIEDSAAPIHDRGGNVVGAVMVFHDVSLAREMVLRMSHLAQHDALTNLPNRVLLNDRLTQAISLARRRRNQLAVLFLDLDLFKKINDSLGHQVGDKLLQSVANRLLTCVRDSDTVSRHGGDEFVVLLSDIERAKDAAYRAAKIISKVADTHSIAGHDINIHASIGISVYPNDGEDADTLIKNADAAMYNAKQTGRNNYKFFRSAMNDNSIEWHSIEAGLRCAETGQEFALHYQPKINLETGKITGAEALIRWRHSTRGLLFPHQFIPVAEQCGLIVPIGRWVLREICQQHRSWLDDGLPSSPVAINICTTELRNKDFLKGVCDILEETCLEPNNLEIELTENTLMQDAESTTPVLKALKDMGVQLTIDDFGTGYSSLSDLQRFPIDSLKIDRSFVRDITTDQDAATLVSAVISMGNRLNMRVSAEGVETMEQLNFLRTEHCGEGQGFHFSRPVVAQEYAALLKIDSLRLQ